MKTEMAELIERANQMIAKNPTGASLMADYMSYMSKYDDFIKKFDQWGGEDLNDAEFAYYMEVQTRAYERLAEAAY